MLNWFAQLSGFKQMLVISAFCVAVTVALLGAASIFDDGEPSTGAVNAPQLSTPTVASEGTGFVRGYSTPVPGTPIRTPTPVAITPIPAVVDRLPPATVPPDMPPSDVSPFLPPTPTPYPTITPEDAAERRREIASWGRLDERSESTEQVRAQSIPAADGILDRVSFLDQPKGNPVGFLQNDAGEKCRYSQVATADDSVSYFYSTLTGSDTLMILEDLTCMTPTTPIGAAFHQRMANQSIAAWYDGFYRTDPTQLSRGGELRVRGWCMQSTTNPNHSILIEYFVDGTSLAAVAHNYGLSEC